MSTGKHVADAPLYRYRFGSAEFDEVRYALSVGGTPLELERKPLEVLQVLLRHAGEVVTKEELFEAVWPGRVTVENVLANAIAKLRKALGEADAERIVTQSRIGYRLQGPIERIAVGRQPVSRMQLRAGLPTPGREHFVLERQLGPTENEVWLARHSKTGELRVYKLSADGEHLPALKREATLSRLLRASLGERDDFVRVIDWNFETPPFFLECEYAGPDLLEWAEHAGRLAALPIEQRLQLFLRIASALAAAHSVGVLHKDLKPLNVLVPPGAGGADPARIKLGDFGASRLLDPERLSAFGITRLGLTLTQNIAADTTSGTVLYLAPEVLRGASPTVQGDVYALGVMLYQLVAGDLRKPMAPGWEQDVADELLRQDIAAATDGNPARRLASAAELIDRLTRLEERRRDRAEASAARERALAAERALERSRARRPWLISALATLTLGLGASLWFYGQAVESGRELARQNAVVRAVNRFMTEDLIGAGNPSLAGRADVTVAEAVKAAIPKIDSAFGAEALEVRAALRRALQESLSALSEPDAAVEQGRKAIEAYQALPRERGALAEARIRLALDLSRLGRYPEARATLATVEPELVQVGEPRIEARYWQAEAVLRADRMDYAGALEADEKAWTLLEKAPEAPPAMRETSLFGMADSLVLLGRLHEGEALLRDLVGRQTLRLGADHPQTLYSAVALANNLRLQRRHGEAEALLVPAIDRLNAALGGENRQTLLAKNVLGHVYYSQNKLDRAVTTYTDVYTGFAKRYGETNQSTVSMLMNVGISEYYAGRLRGAEDAFRRSLRTARALFKDEDHPQVQQARYHLASCLLDQQRVSEAAPLLEGLKPEAINLAAPMPDVAGRLAYQSARVELAAGRPHAALPLLELAAKEIGEKNLYPWQPELARVQALIETTRRRIK